MKRIKYISRFSREMTAEEITQLADQSAKNNSEKGITGIFMALGNLFFQIIEGPFDEINALWNSISQDSRHTDIIVLNVEEDTEERIFPDWSMKSLVLDAATEVNIEPLKAIIELISEWEKRKHSLIRTLEISIIAELSRIEKEISENNN